MSQGNVEIVRQLLEANRSGPADATTEVAIGLTHPNIEFRSLVAAVEGATYRGHEGARRYFEDMGDAWQEWRNDAEEIVEIGPDAVLIENRFRGVGKGSGAEVEVRSAILFVLSDDKVSHIHSYATRREALEAAGLSE